jgi:hypothetical protein
VRVRCDLDGSLKLEERTIGQAYRGRLQSGPAFFVAALYP